MNQMWAAVNPRRLLLGLILGAVVLGSKEVLMSQARTGRV